MVDCVANSVLYNENISAMLLGNLMKQPSLLSVPQYPLVNNDFAPNDMHKIIFRAITVLYNQGVGEITPVELDNVIKNPTAREVLEDNDWMGFVETTKELSSQQNYEYCYNVVRKLSLLRELKSDGIDISQWFDELEDSTKQFAKLEKITIQDILNTLETTSLKLRGKYDVKYVREEMVAGTDVEDLLAEFETHPSFGAFLTSNYLTQIINGVNRGDLFMRSAPSSVGKALPNSIVIPTPNGEKQVGEIKIGDYLFSREGKPTKVIGVYPQGKKKVYELTFKDGRKAKCCDEHLWNVYDYCANKGAQMRTMSVKQLMQKKLRSGEAIRFSVPLNSPVEYPKKEFYIPPYIMGLALGDASFRSQPSNHAFNFSAPDAELVEAIAKTMNWSYKKNSIHNYNWTFYNNSKLVHVEDFLKQYPELVNTYSHNKFIPKDYLFGSISQRTELLRGLLDTDGSIDKVNGSITYSTVSDKLKNDIIYLCRSLGYSATDKLRERKNKNSCWQIRIQMPKEIKKDAFGYSKKKEIAVKYATTIKRKERRDRLSITDIQFLGYEEEMTCFMVDNEEHLFLTNDFIVTHNTRIAVADICNLCVDKYYDYTAEQFVDNPNYQGPGFMIHTELRTREQIQPMYLACISGVPYGTITRGEYTQEEKARVLEAGEILKKNDFYLAAMPDFTTQSIERKIRECVEQRGAVFCSFDYMMLNSALTVEYKAKTATNIREDMVLRALATDLKEMAEDFNVGILTASQLNGAEKTMDFPDESCLSGSKAMKNKLDHGVIMLAAKDRPKELKAVEQFGMTVGHKKFGKPLVPNRITYVYKARFGEYADQKIKIFHHFDGGTMRNTDLFCCDENNYPVDIKNIMPGG